LPVVEPHRRWRDGLIGRIINQNRPISAMNQTITLSVVLTLSLGLTACGGAKATPTTDTPSLAGDSLSSGELAKLSEELRGRVEAQDVQFEVRVTFDQLPSTDALSTLMLVRYQRVAIGRVDLPTLKSIASRDDVQRITLLSGTGYEEEKTTRAL